MSARTEFHGDPIEENTLYVVLYERKAVGEAYHWALLLAGPGESGQIHQATDRNGQWEYEIKDLPQIQPTASMICLVGIGNIQPDKRAKAEEAMRSVHVPPEGGTLRTGEPFNCRTWLKLAVAALQKAGILNLPLHVGKSGTQASGKGRPFALSVGFAFLLLGPDLTRLWPAEDVETRLRIRASRLLAAKETNSNELPSVTARIL
ncbi:uncharacterized protein THITE_2123382 [Thermothielavioides terrestris NRRL 8126]|uniref:Uncharacterized protein n=1 Tax=Thermothielavioides terrestris (strain ATCC 38088 / NRRL 8126) TaxID=578455 RepID=G2RHA0_THETT|nr:uncharacterized protein THITE_2123382 [Thermothielavioides terrestris NRRL 8126]AEO71212.1 hypothetical protein THITE_2123382 [Thermothielavioides terrestris NRRL 8126]